VRDKTVDEAAGDPSAVPMEFSSRKRNEWKECRKIFPDQRILDLVGCFFEFSLPLSWATCSLCIYHMGIARESQTDDGCECD
jgi:hypothetical protein